MSKRPHSRPAMEAAAAELRAIVLQSEDGALIGSEEMLLEKLGFSRSTVRQAARLLEREGYLHVRRGINGGYFGSRPDVRSIANTVSAYLETLDMDARDVTVIASVLWIEVLRKAASVRTEAARSLAETFRERVMGIRPDASFAEVRAVELDSRAAIFDLAKSRYVQLIFDINAAFATRRFLPPSNMDGSAAHRKFVRAWRNAKMMELSAISEGDVELAIMAGRHSRYIWHKRVWTHPGRRE
jgi:GntR family transcriptional regulator, transcriptional repressor for pyruvate dehydrogenase complex